MIRIEYVKEYESGYRCWKMWYSGLNFFPIAPRSRNVSYVKCDTCGSWISEYYLSINHHHREHLEKGEEMTGWTHFFEPSVFTDN